MTSTVSPPVTLLKFDFPRYKKLIIHNCSKTLLRRLHCLYLLLHYFFKIFAMSSSHNNSSQSETEEDDFLEVMFPYLQQGQQRAEQANRDMQPPNPANPPPDLLERLLPSVNQAAKDLNKCCLCLEDIQEGAKFTRGLGCPCKPIFSRTTCFEDYLNSCTREARCPVCRSSWSEDLVVID